MALTDAQGGFVIAHLPAGQYSVSASRNTFLTTNYGQKRPAGPGTTLVLAEGQKLTLNLQLLRGGVISGTVFGEDGDPAAQTQVQVWRFATNNGIKRLQRANGASTDDRGAYRISGLQPGDYFVSATASNSDAVMADRMLADTALIEQAIAAGAVQAGAAPGLPATVAIPVPQPPQTRSPGFDNSPPGFVPVFHPNTIEPRNATVVRVAGGDEHRFIDIQMRLASATNIVGSVTNPPGQDLGVQIFLMNDDSFMDSTTSTRADPNGQFVFRNIPPGKYSILAEVIPSPQPTIVNGVSTQRVGPLPPLEDSQRMWARDSVSVDGQPAVSSSITLRPGKSISGVVNFDMQRPPDLTRSRMTVTLQFAADSPQVRYGQLPTAVVGPDGRFTINGVSPGRYQIRGPGFTKSAIVDGKDTLDFPFDFNAEADLTNAVVTVTDQLTEIAGTLTDASGKPVADESVVIAATDERYWTPGSRRITYTRTRADGQYVFRNLPPGSYVLAVAGDLEFGMQYDLEFLRTLAASGSTRVTLADGEKLQRDLRVAK
jgi:protocatechuate 3,4-dioxygenase beta subunit